MTDLEAQERAVAGADGGQSAKRGRNNRRTITNPYRHDGRSGTPAMSTPGLAAYPSPSASPDDYRPVPRRGTRIRRRTVIIAVAGWLAACWRRPSGSRIPQPRPARPLRYHRAVAATGSINWARPTGGPIYFSSPAVANGILYIGSTDGKAYALDAATGGILWTYATGHEITRSPAVAGGLVYIGSDDGNLYAFSTAPHHDYRGPATPMAGVTSSARQEPRA